MQVVERVQVYASNSLDLAKVATDQYYLLTPKKNCSGTFLVTHRKIPGSFRPVGPTCARTAYIEC